MSGKMKPAKDDDRDRQLRTAAEEELAQAHGAPVETAGQNVERALHELQVHQIELEMQNEELKRTQRALEDSKDKYVNLYDFAPLGYFTLTPVGQIAEVNLAGASLLGVTRSELVGHGFARFVVREDLGRWDQHLLNVLQSDQKQTCELTLKREDGPSFYAQLDGIRRNQCAAEPVTADPGPVIRVAMSDISDHKQAENVLQQAAERLKEIVRLAPAFMCIVRGREHVFEMCNDRYFQLVGRRDILNLPIRRALPELEGQGFFELLDGVFATGTPYSGREVPVRLRRTPGEPLEEVYVDFVYMPLREADSSISGIFVHGVDVTEEFVARSRIEQLAQERQKVAEELARSNKDLEQFAAVASHDLQEPLRAVNGFLHLLQKKHGNQLEPEAGQFVAYAMDGAKRMENLIRDLLAYARVGSRGQKLVPTDTAAALRQAMDNLIASIQESAAEITHGELPTVRADPSQLAQLFQNLIDNAMKVHGEEPPKIHVDASRQNDHWRFSVRDNGVGIAPEFRDHVFVIFQRLHTHTQFPGTGIGLAICKRIVDRHGGSIWVESQPGQGATFHFTIPI